MHDGAVGGRVVGYTQWRYCGTEGVEDAGDGICVVVGGEGAGEDGIVCGGVYDAKTETRVVMRTLNTALLKLGARVKNSLALAWPIASTAEHRSYINSLLFAPTWKLSPFVPVWMRIQSTSGIRTLLLSGENFSDIRGRLSSKVK